MSPDREMIQDVVTSLVLYITVSLYTTIPIMYLVLHILNKSSKIQINPTNRQTIPIIYLISVM